MENERHIQRGDIYYADLRPVIGSEQDGVRPVLIIQNDIGNHFSPTIIAAAITSKTMKANLPTHEFYSLPLLVVDAIHLPDSWTPNILIEVMITVVFFILFFVLKLLSYKEMEIYYPTNTKHGLGDIEKTNDQEETTQNSALTYPLSIMIVMFLMFLGWRVTDFKLDELTEMLVLGDYLAFPIAVIVLFVLFYILVQLMHAIILMTGRMTSQKIVTFLNASDHALKLTEKVSQILKLIVGIILDTILTTLAFVKFIPDFFTAMQKMVLEEDEEDEEEGTVEGKHAESRKGPEDTEPKET